MNDLLDIHLPDNDLPNNDLPDFEAVTLPDLPDLKRPLALS